MVRLIANNLHLVPQDIDLIVGIPRSGILPAITISLMLNLRYADLDSFLDGRLSGAGSTKRHSGLIDDTCQARHILVIDDSLNRGYAMQEAKERLSKLDASTKVSFAAIYVVPDGQDQVDILFEAVPLPRIFEWNFIHHVYLAHSCVAIDGVLCVDPLPEDLADEASYLGFLANASPRYRPTQRIACLVTDRPEKYRPQTEAWLNRHGILYDQLVMRDLPFAEHRQPNGEQSEFKGNAYRDSKAFLFIESDHSQAVEIAKIAGKPVLSLERQEMINPQTWSGIAAIQRFRNFGVHAEMTDSPLVNRQAFKRKLRRVLPEPVYAALRRLVAKILAIRRDSHAPRAGSIPGTALASPPDADADMANMIEQTKISGAHVTK